SPTSMASYDFASAASLSGRLGSPDASRGDQAALVDFVTNAAHCRSAAGVASLNNLTLSASHTAESISRDTSSVAPNILFPTPQERGATLGRVTNGLGALNTGIDIQSSWLLSGAIPSPQLPGLTASAPMSRLDGVQLPVPVMATLLQCPQGPLSGGP